MPRKNLGFTIMELLAAIAILGIMVTVTIPIVMTVMNSQKNKQYIEDSIRLVSVTEYKMRSDNKVPIPAKGKCVVMSLAHLDDDTFEDAPSEGTYDKMASFVVAKRNSGVGDEEYSYYVRLVEKLKSGSYKGVNLENVDDLYREKAEDNYVANLESAVIFSLSDFKNDEVGLQSQISYINDDIQCENIVKIYPDEQN